MSYKEEENIFSIVKRMESDYVSGKTTISKYVDISMKDTLDRIDAYLNSRHISGEFDALGRPKPFFNICTAACNIWYRATDIDRKNIRIKPTKVKDVIDVFLANIHVQDWMKREDFGSFLNEWGRVLSRYGSAVLKFVEQDNKLHCNVVPWQRLIVDAVDFENNIKIEILELTEAQLKLKKNYDSKVIEDICSARTVRKTIEGIEKDTKNDYIKLYEVHGKLPLSFLTDNEEDDDVYVQQMHVITNVEDTEGYFTLIRGKEEKDPFMITHLIKEDGQTLSIGAVQHLFNAQWMLNHTVKNIKDYLDLASKIILQSSDSNFVGQNALVAIETGDILVHQPGQSVTQIQFNPTSISSFQNFGNQWKALANEITGISESMLGNTAPSGAAWRQVEAILNESHSLFELMTENKGLYIEKMFRNYIIPFIKKKMDTTEEIVATLNDYDLKKIDNLYIKNQSIRQVNRILKDKLLKEGQIATPEGQAQLTSNIQDQIRTELASLDNLRGFKPDEIDSKTWKELFKDLEWEVEVDVTGENVDQNATTTLNTMLMTIAKNPTILNNPNVKLLWNKILMQTGTVSPIEMSATQSEPQVAPTNAGGV